MATSSIELRYPIGPFEPPEVVTREQVSEWIDQIDALPGNARRFVTPLSTEQLETPYRPGGWTVQQVVHHMADSHLSSFIRFKWGLTEERPLIKAYYEERWAELADYRSEFLGLSLDFLDALHARWCVLLRALSEEQLAREFIHPDSGVVKLAVNVGIYAWHGRHHMAHIERLAEREGW